MRVLGIAGSPRRGGNTDTLLGEFLKGAAERGAETRVITLSELKIAPCEHCDICLKKGKCKIDDDMTMVIEEMEKAHIIVLASPVHFMGVTAQMKTMIDRAQVLWARKYVLKQPPLGGHHERLGFFISVGGRKVTNLFQPSLETVKSFFRVMDATYAGELLFPGVDEKDVILHNPDARRQANIAGQMLADRCLHTIPGATRS